MTEEVSTWLTPVMVRTLRLMQDAETACNWEAAEIIQCGLSCWIGDVPISARTGHKLNLLVLISNRSHRGESCLRYALNSEGRDILVKPGYTPLIVKHRAGLLSAESQS